MSYLFHVSLAYGVFLAMLAWDFIVPRLQVRRQLREARNRHMRDRRQQAAAGMADDRELSR